MTSGGTAAAAGGLSPRRELTIAALVCAVAAGLVLLAASRTWQIEFVERPAPLGPQRTPHTGGALVPALPAMGLVVLAGAGALFATRGPARRLVGMLVLVCGAVATVLGGVWSGHSGVTPGWPLLALAGGLLAIASGAFTAVRGAAWPALGRRYDRPDSSVHSGQPTSGATTPGQPKNGTTTRGTTTRGTPPHGTAPGAAVTATGADNRDPVGGTTDRTGGSESEQAPGASRDLWDALDRGEDPTRG